MSLETLGGGHWPGGLGPRMPCGPSTEPWPSPALGLLQGPGLEQLHLETPTWGPGAPLLGEGRFPRVPPALARWKQKLTLEALRRRAEKRDLGH